VRLRDLGEHRLKDLIDLEHVFQLEIDGLTNESPPLRSLGNLAAPQSAVPVELRRPVADLEKLRRLVHGAGSSRFSALGQGRPAPPSSWLLIYSTGQVGAGRRARLGER
jgi:hypothetical protein